MMSTDKTAPHWPHWPHGTDFPEGGPHAGGPSRVEEIRERWAQAIPGPWATTKPAFGFVGVKPVNGKPGESICGAPKHSHALTIDAIAHAPEDIAFLLAKVERLTADLDQTRAAAREQLAERDRIISEVTGEMEALRDMGVEPDTQPITQGAAVVTADGMQGFYLGPPNMREGRQVVACYDHQNGWLLRNMTMPGTAPLTLYPYSAYGDEE